MYSCIFRQNERIVLASTMQVTMSFQNLKFNKRLLDNANKQSLKWNVVFYNFDFIIIKIVHFVNVVVDFFICLFKCSV